MKRNKTYSTIKGKMLTGSDCKGCAYFAVQTVIARIRL